MKLLRLGILIASLSLVASMAIGCQPQFQPGAYSDDIGREVTIDEIPQRIISFGPSITETLFALGLDKKVVGVSDFCDYPEATKSKQTIGNAFNPSIEKIVELEPDLVLTLKHEQLNTNLDALGIKFMVLSPKDIDGILKDIELVGEITGVTKVAKKLVQDMQDSISQVSAQVKNAPKVRVFFIVDATDLNNPWTAGLGSFIDTLITTAGGENVANETVGAWAQFSIEQIVSADPDIIIIQTMTGDVPTVSKAALKAHPIWGEMSAVKYDRTYLINGDLVSRPGPRIVQGLKEMAKIIHPELFTE